MIKIGMADDHALIRQSLANLVSAFGSYEVVWQAANGKEVQQEIQKNEPELLLLDIRMPQMDGFETCAWVTKNYPNVKILALSMMDEEAAVVKMVKNGARGYLLKDSDPADLKEALHTLYHKGFFYNEMVTGRLLHTILVGKESETAEDDIHLNGKELDFLKLTCSEFTYREIADRMNLSPRTIDGYREVLFEKLGVKSRVGLVLFAVKKGLLQL